MLKLKMEKKMNKEKLDNGLLIKVYKLTNNKTGLNYRVIVREKRFGKIIHDKMFFTKEGVEEFINNHLNCTPVVDPFANRHYIEFMKELKNVKTDKDRDILMEKTIAPIYTGGCEGLIVKHKTNGVRVINYDFLDNIRYDEVNEPKLKNDNSVAEANLERTPENRRILYNYIKENGITNHDLYIMIKNGFDNINYKDIDNAIVRFKHKLYRH